MNNFFAKKKFSGGNISDNIGFIKNLDMLKKKIHNGGVKTINLGFCNNYSNLSYIQVNPDKFIEEIASNGFHIDSKVFFQDIKGKSFINNSKKFILKPDLSSIRKMDWKENSLLCFADVYNTNLNTHSEVCSRGILKRSVKYIEDQGYKLNCASEFEYYIYQNTYSENFTTGLNNLKSIGSQAEDYLIQQGDLLEYLHEEFRIKLKNSGIEIENTKGESGLGQHEINMKYSDAILQADNALVLKAGTKGICNKHKANISFMAKPDIENSGSSCHLHLSLHDKTGKNIFVGNDYKLTDKTSCSMNLVYFLGGIMHYSLDTFVLFAPTINSYKRYKAFSWAPSNLDNWSYDNRTSPFRICGSNKNLRIEYRIPGADAHQYLSYSAIIASGMKGIKEKIVPPHVHSENSYELENFKNPPIDLCESLEYFKESNLIKEFFTNEEILFLTKFYENEIYEYEKNVTDFEHRRYFNLI